MKTQTNTRNILPPSGLTLLEVLIALLVLSIGLVGVAALTIQSLQNTHSALYTSLASAAALDFEERLWLELGREREPQCPDPGTVTDPDPGNYIGNWTSKGNALGLPGFEISSTSDSEQTLSPVRMIEFTIGWDEGRFGKSRESFEYKTRVPCRTHPLAGANDE